MLLIFFNNLQIILNSAELSHAGILMIQGCFAVKGKGKKNKCEGVSGTVMKSDLVIFRDAQNIL